MTLNLRGPAASDLEDLLRWHSDKALMSQVLGFRFPVAETDVREWLTSQTGSTRQASWVIDVSGRAIGVATMRAIDWVFRSAEVGLYIGSPDDRAKGHGGESLAILKRIAYESLNLRRLTARIVSSNGGALRLFEAAGFEHEGKLREAAYLEGSHQDVIVLGHLRFG